MHLHDAMLATLRIYFLVIGVFYCVILILAMFTYIIAVLFEMKDDDSSEDFPRGDKRINPFYGGTPK